MNYTDFIQLIMKIHIKNDIGTTQKTQGKPFNEGAENTCFRGF